MQLLRPDGSFVAEPVEVELGTAQIGGVAYNNQSGTLVVCESNFDRHRVHIISSFT